MYYMMYGSQPVISSISPLIRELENDITVKWKNQRKGLYA